MMRHWKSIHILMGILLILSACATTSDPRVPGATIAIWDFENLSLPGQGPPDLGAMLTAKAMEAVQHQGEFQVVERERLEKVLEELNLGSSAVADEGARLNLGRLTGATLMVFGAYQVIGQQMRLDLRLVDVETGRVISAQRREVAAYDIKGWLNTAGPATLALLAK